ncbi:MAG: hypothetical protein ACREDN_01295 [Aestuariivirga sp.]
MKTFILHSFNLPSMTASVTNAVKPARRDIAMKKGMSLLSTLPPYLLSDIGLPGFDKLPLETQEEQYARAVMAKEQAFSPV